MTFGDLTVLRYEGNKKWVCLCSCSPDKEISVNGCQLRDGRKTHCGCKKKYNKRSDIVFPNEYKDKTKPCKECGEIKPYEDFYFQEKINKNGDKYYYFYTKCIECEKKRAYQRILDNMDEHREIIRRNNKRPNIIQIKREFGKKQRENGYMTAYRQSEKFKANNKGYGLDRRHKNHNMDKKEWISCKDYFKDDDGDWCCAYCGLKHKDHYRTYAGELQNIDLHKEHVVHNGENDLSNCVPSCQNCNSQKWEFSLDEWYNDSNPNFTQERYNKVMKWITEDYKLFVVEKRNKRK